jgi:hypothetical protein
VLYARLSAPPPSLAERVAGLLQAADAVLARGLAKSPEERYARGGEFAHQLRLALALPVSYAQHKWSAGVEKKVAELVKAAVS